jgi:uncharacterized protein (TIGR03437 family)
MYRTVLAMAALVSAAFAQVNVLTANYSNERTNANLQEAQLTPSSFVQGSFGKIGTLPVDGQVYAQPLYVSGLTIPGQGNRNVLFVATQHNSVYAYDADSLAEPVILWHVNLGPSVPSTTFGPNYRDIQPEIGILSTPAIDLERLAIYVVTANLTAGGVVYRLHALGLATGEERMNGPVALTATLPGNSVWGNGDGTVSLDPIGHLQRPGLLLANGAVYVAYGSHADQGAWHGWLLIHDASDLTHRFGAYTTTPNGMGAAIWQSGRGLPADDAGSVYAVTGNGDFDGISNFAESFLRFSGTTPVPADWYTPMNWQFLADGDYDLSSGLALVPGTHLLLGGDKYGQFYLVNGDSMGHLGGNAQVIQAVQWGGIFNFAIWNRADGAYVYVQEQGSVLKCYLIADSRISTAPVAVSTVGGDMANGGMAISADGVQNGILWETTTARSRPARPAMLHAYDASNLAELWNSEMNAADNLGGFAKFAAPTVANGKVFVPTSANVVVVYGLKQGLAALSRAPAIAAIANGASGSQAAIAPGEVITVIGRNIGPSLPLAAAGTDAAATASVVQVLFDGAPAPVLKASDRQISAVVPFGIAQGLSHVQVQYGDQTSNPYAIPVMAAQPGLFSAGWSGAGQAAVENADGSINSIDNPAAAGSTILLFATGLGQFSPPVADGALISGDTLPQPVLPVSVQVGGRPAGVRFAGSVPGMVAGFVQIQIQLPAGISGPAVPVMLQAGAWNSQETATISIAALVAEPEPQPDPQPGTRPD